MTCTGPECDRPPTRGKLCATHYAQRWRGRELTPIISRSTPDMSLTERIALKTVEVDGCHVWQAGTNQAGYGIFKAQGQWWQAHRAAYTEANGSIPEGMYVLHRCDNPPCCNPEHLFLGTQADNTDDMWQKGRARPYGRVKLEPDDVLAIRASEETGVALAKKYGVAVTTISAVRTRRNWKRL